jgi:fibronectin-binding autotransporter adhesin
LAPNNGNVRIGGNAGVLAGAISGSGNVTILGSSLKVTGVSTYTGNTTIAEGTLELGGNNRLPSGTSLTLNGAAGATLNTAGFSQTFGSLGLAGNTVSATIDMGSGASVLNFTNSSLNNWNNSSLFINNWSGSPSGGGTDRVFVGSNNFAGLTHAQLNSIQFGVGFGALLLNTGELVPNMTGIPLPLPVRGDLDGNGSVTGADIPAMLQALTNIGGYQTTHLLSDGDLLGTMDVDNSGVINNRDIQSLLNLVQTLGGGSLAAVPEPSTLLMLVVGTAGLLGLRRRSACLRK